MGMKCIFIEGRIPSHMNHIEISIKIDNRISFIRIIVSLLIIKRLIYILLIG